MSGNFDRDPLVTQIWRPFEENDLEVEDGRSVDETKDDLGESRYWNIYG